MLQDQSKESWASMVKTIELDKKRLPWDPAKVEPVVRTNLAARKLAERDLDILVMEFRDPDREDKVRAKTAKVYDMVKTRVEDTKKNKFNILNHEGPPRKLDLMPRVEKDTSTRDWHLLSHLPKDYHKKYPMSYDDELSRTLLQRPKKDVVTRGIPREFDVISNNYKVNHDEQLKKEYEKIKDYTLQKYWRSHDLNIIVGEYYDEKKEHEYLDQRSLADSVQGLDQMRKLPPSFKYSEGNTYNIVNHEISNDERFMTASAVRDRSKNRSKGAAIAAAIKKADEERQDRDNSRSMNRVSFKRWENIIDRGFHIVNNTRFAEAPSDAASGGTSSEQTTTTAAAAAAAAAGNTTEFNRTYLPHPARPVTVWDRFKVNNNGPATGGNDDFLEGNAPQFFKAHTGDLSSSSSEAKLQQQQQQQHIRKPMTAAQASSSARAPANQNQNHNNINSNNNNSNNNHSNNNSINNNNNKRNLPNIDISGTIKHADVTYKEPLSGHAGQPVPIITIRTGGFK